MNPTAAERTPVVFRLGHMGDVALITGVLSHWHRTHGETFVVVTREGNLPLLENHPAVAGTVGLTDQDLTDSGWLRKTGELARRFAGAPLYDLHGTLRSRMLALRWKGEVRRYPKFGITRRLFERTRSDRFRAKLEALNVPQRYALARDDAPPPREALLPTVHLTETEQAEAATRLAPLSGDNPLVALHPYATHPSKQWPMESWTALTGLLDGAGFDWFVVGRNQAPLLPDHGRDLTNATGLRATCALLGRADLLVTGDSGPMHLAAGVGTPVVALFGPTARAWGFYPAGPRDTVLEHALACRPCSLHGAKQCTRGFECMTLTRPEAVLDAVRAVLG
ncbi:glycosyltransferase family 9 protein [Pseudodesulfovibrio indicus]|uniref:ADP-heptose:LPS heptosyltransferase n=1 Tax=Pseudodesulfovibrio indicus TaxID=1716143 RepID=A0A126QRM5_9BACT|nr:glycosyltransferase family 9 protein [Pseudodesulfovibrio indicus]AMK12356.1 glycosyl transferase [Pseudodesulfovibrio indicus]TDT90646.1 ADP-heptose:LPS heptosyltransferase [Pseudodesulfovibrio indicus]